MEETLGPDRISGSLFLARRTERQSGLALSQWCRKVLRFPYYLLTAALFDFASGWLAGASRAGQFPVSHKWLRLGPSVVIVPRISKTWCQHFLRTSPCARRREVLPNQQTLTCEKRRLRPRSSRRLRNLSMTSSFSSLRAVLATALPCSDEYSVGWRDPQTQRRFCAQQEIDWLLDGLADTAFVYDFIIIFFSPVRAVGVSHIFLRESGLYSLLSGYSKNCASALWSWLVLVCCLPNVAPSAPCRRTLKVSGHRLLCLLIGHIQHHRFGPHEQVKEHCVRWKHRTLRQRGQLCGSERLEDMKVVNFIHLPRWSRCDRAGCTYW